MKVDYHFCFLCKDRLEVIHDEYDEGWYFVNAKQIRVQHNQDMEVHNVHAICLKELELAERQIGTTEPKVGEKRQRMYERVVDSGKVQRKRIECMV